jgi:hypothetical protein
MKRVIKRWDEQDALTPWRTLFKWRPGQISAIKRRARRRERHEWADKAMDVFYDIE